MGAQGALLGLRGSDDAFRPRLVHSEHRAPAAVAAPPQATSPKEAEAWEVYGFQGSRSPVKHPGNADSLQC